jgi:hypothetical protein
LFSIYKIVLCYYLSAYYDGDLHASLGRAKSYTRLCLPIFAE